MKQWLGCIDFVVVGVYWPCRRGVDPGGRCRQACTSCTCCRGPRTGYGRGSPAASTPEPSPCLVNRITEKEWVIDWFSEYHWVLYFVLANLFSFNPSHKCSFELHGTYMFLSVYKMHNIFKLKKKRCFTVFTGGDWELTLSDLSIPADWGSDLPQTNDPPSSN